MKNWHRFFNLVIILSFAFLSCTEKKEAELLTIDELITFQKNAQAKIADPDSVKIWGNDNIRPVNVTETKTIFTDEFKNLDNWQHEGIGFLNQPDSNIFQINCVGSSQGNEGCMAFCKTDFPDSIVIEYDLFIMETNGLVINFIAGQGRHGEDMLTELPERRGVFDDYIRNPDLRSYHVSISRYDDSGKHTGVSNWRRNPGIFLMAQQPDLCKEPRVWYHIKILKLGSILQMWVDNNFAGGFEDLNEIPEPIPQSGKFGFRAIGSLVRAQVKNLQVFKIIPQSITKN